MHRRVAASSNAIESQIFHPTKIQFFYDVIRELEENRCVTCDPFDLHSDFCFAFDDLMLMVRVLMGVFFCLKLMNIVFY